MASRSKLKVIYLGCTQYSKDILEFLIDEDVAEICAICTIPEEFNISYSEGKKVKNSNFADLKPIAEQLNAPLFMVDSVKGQRMTDYIPELEKLDPDVILVMGWYYMIPSKVRNVARHGAWGIHASLLPKYAGGAPLVWAIIEGEKETGISLFRMEDGVDDGDLIRQSSFPIELEDTIKEVYAKATQHSKETLKQVFADPENIQFTPQDKDAIEVYPQRSPKDGEIDWSWSVERINNFIRAQTKPYPGAWTTIAGKKVTIWSATIE